MVRRFPYLSGVLLGAVFFGALDVLLTRFTYNWRPFDAGIVWQSPVLWLSLGLVALPFFALAGRFLLQRADAPEAKPWPRVALGVLATAAPVAGHVLLSRHAGIDGELSGFKTPWPWLEVGGLVLVVIGGALILKRLGSRIRWNVVAFGLVLASVVMMLVKPSSISNSAGTAPPSADQPNVLLLVWDTCRSDRLMPYHYDRETTPNLAEFASEAVVFEEARSVCSFTFTSHLSMLTGVYPTTHGGRLLNSVVDPRRSTSVAQLFADAGYRTGAFVGTSVLTGKTGIRIGFDHYDDQVDPSVAYTRAWELINDLQVVAAKIHPPLRNNGNPHWFQNFQRPATDVLSRAKSWMDEDEPRPWFCMINLYDIHWPFLPEGDGQKLVRPYGGPLDGYFKRSNDYPKKDASGNKYEITEADRQHISDLYDAELFDLDAVVDEFLAELSLDAGGTAVLLTSDHGEAFGEAPGVWLHDDIIEPQVRIPFLVRPAAAAPEGGRVVGLVSGIDVGPTLLGLAGLEVPGSMQGLDLTRGTPDPERTIRVEDRDHPQADDVRIASYSGYWKYLELGLEDKVTRLYDLRSDPIGLVDVSGSYPEVAKAMKESLEEALEGAELAPESIDGNFDTSALEALGYMGNDEDQ